MAPQHLRMLAYLSGSHGWLTMDLRTLSLETGLDYRYMNVVLDALEAAGLVEIRHGRSDADPQGAKANSYHVTRPGRVVVPEVLRQTLSGNYVINHPMWSHKGYNLHGLVVALTLGPGHHEVDSARIARILGCDRRSAIKRLKSWAAKGWARRFDRSTYLLDIPEGEPMEALVDMEAFVPEEANRSAERKAAWVAQSRAAKKAVVKVIEEVGHWIPAALVKIREVGIEVMTEFLDALAAPLAPRLDPVEAEAMMEALRRRGTS